MVDKPDAVKSALLVQQRKAEAEECEHWPCAIGLDELAMSANMRSWEGPTKDTPIGPKPLTIDDTIQWIQAGSGAFYSLTEILTVLIAKANKADREA